MTKILPLLVLAPLAFAACNREKKLTDEEMAAELRKKDRSDMAGKIATGREAEAKKELLEKATNGK